MTPIRRLLVCAIVPTVLGACAAPAAPAASLLPGCGGPGDSALNQYCESVPTAGGPQRPLPGERTVGQAATPALLAAIHRAIPNQAALRTEGPRLRPLMSLPAARSPARTSPSPTAAGTGNSLSVSDLILVVVGLTVLGGLVGGLARATASARHAG